MISNKSRGMLSSPPVSPTSLPTTSYDDFFPNRQSTKVDMLAFWRCNFKVLSRSRVIILRPQEDTKVLNYNINNQNQNLYSLPSSKCLLLQVFARLRKFLPNYLLQIYSFGYSEQITVWLFAGSDTGRYKSRPSTRGKGVLTLLKI